MVKVGSHPASLWPAVAEDEESRNPCSEDAFENAKPTSELSKRLAKSALNEASKPENTPEPPDDTVPVVSTESVEAKDTSRN